MALYRSSTWERIQPIRYLLLKLNFVNPDNTSFFKREVTIVHAMVSLKFPVGVVLTDRGPLSGN